MRDDYDDEFDERDDFESEDFGSDEFESEEFESNDLESDDETVPCPYCGEPYFEDAPQCPQCGNYVSREDQPYTHKPFWYALIVLFVVLTLVLGLCNQ